MPALSELQGVLGDGSVPSLLFVYKWLNAPYEHDLSSYKGRR